MSTWAEYQRQAKITFATPAPPGAPELRGTRCYFTPEVLHWSVGSDWVFVRVAGPASRVKYRVGDRGYVVESTRGGGADVLPDWLVAPAEMLAEAKAYIERIEKVRST